VQFVSDRCPITPRKHDKKQANVEDAVGAGFFIIDAVSPTPSDTAVVRCLELDRWPGRPAQHPAPSPPRVESWCLASDGPSGEGWIPLSAFRFGAVADRKLRLETGNAAGRSALERPQLPSSRLLSWPGNRGVGGLSEQPGSQSSSTHPVTCPAGCLATWLAHHDNPLEVLCSPRSLEMWASISVTPRAPEPQVCA